MPRARRSIDHLASHEWISTTLRQDEPPGESSRVALLFRTGSPTADAALVVPDWAHSLLADAWVLYVRPWDISRGGHYFVETRLGV